MNLNALLPVVIVVLAASAVGAKNGPPMSISLMTDDGLRLELDRSNGNGTGLTIGGRSFGLSGPLVRFEEVIEDPEADDLLAEAALRYNDSHHSGLDGGSAAFWGMPEESVEEPADGETPPPAPPRHGEARWMRVSVEDSVRPKTHVEINQTEPQPLVLSGECRAKVEGSAFGWWDRNLALNANVTYSDGTRMPEVSAYFGQYDHGPQSNKRVICPDRPIKSLDIDLSVPGGKCTAWYRDVKLKPARYLIYSPTTPLKRMGHAVEQEFDCGRTPPQPSPPREGSTLGENHPLSAAERGPGGEVQGLLEYRPKPECIEVRCSFESRAAVDRAVSAYFAIPFDAVGGVWYDDARTSRKIEAGGIYRNASFYGAGRDGYNSRYPFACIETASGRGLALGTSVGEPRVFHAEYDAGKRELRIRFDIGLSPGAPSPNPLPQGEGAQNGVRAGVELLHGSTACGSSTPARTLEGKWANKGSFTAYLFTFTDGFRGAAEKYYRIFPWAFENRVEKQGTWLAFMTPPAIVEHEDFHFQFLESVGHMGWDEAHGKYSLRYAEPWIHHQDDVTGPADPQGSISLAKRMNEADDKSLPLDIRRRFAAYPGSWIEDPWGNPQGYLFRGGRNENMMIVNPDDRLPSGAWDREIIRETMAVKRDWSIDGWTIASVGYHPFLQVVDNPSPALPATGRGHRCIRLDPVEGVSQYEQYLRGISQIRRYESDPGELTFSYSARGEQVPATGSLFTWRITVWYADGTSSGSSFPVQGLTSEWKTATQTVKLEKRPKFISVGLDSPARTPDPTVLWLDEVHLTDGKGRDLLVNGGFEEAELLPCRLDGVYLDTMECYLANLNYRREHWAHAEEPLTFDCARRPAMHQVYSHVACARRMAEWMHPLGRLVFGNCTPTTPFAAPHLDIMGTELSWKQGDTWIPWPDAEFNFARFMSRGKPYCMLQYGNLSVREQTRYVKRCLFYGVLPSNQAAPSGGWYWADPMIVEKHRPVFAAYVPIIIKIAEAGWQPLTLARTDDESVWIERFGDGEEFYLTVFNPGRERKSATVTLDPRSGATSRSRLTDVLRAESLRWNGTSWQFELDPEDVAVYRISR